jgi:Flp pilus assembly protein TadB
VILWVIGSALDGRLKNHAALGLAAASAMLVTTAVAWHTSSLAMTICGLLWGAGFLLMLLPMGARDNQSREAPRNLADAAEGRQ